MKITVSNTIALTFSKYNISRKFSTACSFYRNCFLIAAYLVLERRQQVLLVIHPVLLLRLWFSFYLFSQWWGFFFPPPLLVLCPFVGKVLSWSVCHNWKWNNGITMHQLCIWHCWGTETVSVSVVVTACSCYLLSTTGLQCSECLSAACWGTLEVQAQTHTGSLSHKGVYYKKTARWFFSLV